MEINPKLLEQCRNNDRRAHNELFRQCYGFMMAICLRYTNNREDARALLNLAFLKTVRNLDKYRIEIPFGSWLSRVTVNTIIDSYRRNKKHREHLQTVDMQESRSIVPLDFNEAAQMLDAESLQRMIQQLPETSRKVFNLYAIDGYTHKEIGEMLGMSDGTSKWHVSHARSLLQKMLHQYMNQMMTHNYSQRQ